MPAAVVGEPPVAVSGPVQGILKTPVVVRPKVAVVEMPVAVPSSLAPRNYPADLRGPALEQARRGKFNQETVQAIKSVEDLGDGLKLERFE